MRHLTVENTGGKVAIEINNSNVTVFDVNASSTNGTGTDNTAIKIHGGGTSVSTSLCKVTAYAYGSTPIGIEFDDNLGKILDSDVTAFAGNGGGGDTEAIGILMNDSATTPTGGGSATLTNVDINAIGGTLSSVGLRLDDLSSVIFKDGTAFGDDFGLN